MPKAKARKQKKVLVRSSNKLSPVMQVGVVFVIVAAIALVAYAVKMF